MLVMGREYSESLAATVDRETRRIVDECHTRAYELLRRERARLESLAEMLLVRESLTDDEIRRAAGFPVDEAPVADGRADVASRAAS